MERCNAQLLRFRGDTARCALRFDHFGSCREDARTHRMATLAVGAVRRGNTWSMQEAA